MRRFEVNPNPEVPSANRRRMGEPVGLPEATGTPAPAVLGTLYAPPYHNGTFPPNNSRSNFGVQLPLPNLNTSIQQIMGRPQFICPICNLKETDFPARINFQAHLEMHMQELLPPFKCQICSMYFPSIEMLKFHKETGHHDLIACLPIVDVRKPDVKELMISLGSKYYLSLARFTNDQADGAGFVGAPMRGVGAAAGPSAAQGNPTAGRP